MIKRYLLGLLSKNREFLLNQSLAMQGFMQVLMKQRNTGERWTGEEKKQIRQHLKTMAVAVPVIIFFLAPGGGLLLPLLVDVLDRRKNKRQQKTGVGASSTRNGDVGCSQ
jgi:hypothetical protein